MKEIDHKIREALQAEDAELFEEFGGEQSLGERVMDTFRGRSRWLVYLILVEKVIFFLLTILAAVKFFRVETVREMIAWATAFLMCLAVTMALKFWYWMELNKNAITREVKRLELEIARLAKRLPAKPE